MENPLNISWLNDFIFCPVSIYFHNVDSDADLLTFQNDYQLNGSAVHEKTDTAQYSDRKNILQAIPVYSHTFGVYGRIDVFDADSGVLTERKKKITTIYDGYVFQLYAQYYSLIDMGYAIKSIRLHSYDDNKNYPIPLPKEDACMYNKFKKVIKEIQDFSFDNFTQENPLKCQSCIYEPMCSYSAYKE